MLIKYKGHLFKDELRVFLRVRAERVVRGMQLTFLNVLGMNKDGLIAYCNKQKNVPIKL